MMGKPSRKRKNPTAVTHVWSLMCAGFTAGADPGLLVWARFPVQYERDGKLAIAGFDAATGPFLNKPMTYFERSLWNNSNVIWFIPKADLAIGAVDATTTGGTTFFAQPWAIGDTLKDAAVVALAYGAWADHLAELAAA